VTTESSGLDFDLIVLGGGPGGSTLATLVAMQGHRVLLLERERFPRHQLGESLLPATIHGVCPLLGVREEVESAGFPRKRGGTFLWGTSPTPWTFNFAKTENSATGYAYQVERARFDKILLDNARRKGVDVREEHHAIGPIMEGDRVVGVRYTDAEGAERSARARVVADAGGHRSQLYKLCGERVFSKFFQNVALYAYFEGGKRLPPPNSGNILCAAFNEGWFWYIPLTDKLTSVGAVVSKEHAEKLMKEGNERAFSAWVEACPIIKEYLAPATRVTTGMYGEYRVRKDYSYCNTKFWRPGLMLIGDAACFIDPVFSSGVHLATYSAVLAARSMNTLLRGYMDEASVFEEAERRYRREFGNFYQFLTAFYDMHQNEESYFWKARKVLNTEEKGNEAFVRLVAGLSQEDEPLFQGGDGYFEAREGIGEWFQGVVASEGEGAVAPKELPTFDLDRFDPNQFMMGFTSEISQLQLQALLGKHRPPESPLFAGGLVPTADGLHWRRASL
jgi:halogenation protein CepH